MTFSRFFSYLSVEFFCSRRTSAQSSVTYRSKGHTITCRICYCKKISCLCVTCYSLISHNNARSKFTVLLLQPFPPPKVPKVFKYFVDHSSVYKGDLISSWFLHKFCQKNAKIKFLTPLCTSTRILQPLHMCAVLFTANSERHSLKDLFSACTLLNVVNQ